MARTITETVQGVSFDYSPITEETAGLVFGDRNADYGHPVEDFSKTAGFWTVYKGVAFTPEDVAQMMSLVKVSRQMHRPKRDNPVDNCGYQECLQRIIQARAAGVPITDWNWVAPSVEEFRGYAEEMDRVNELVPPGVSVEDLVACWEANHGREGQEPDPGDGILTRWIGWAKRQGMSLQEANEYRAARGWAELSSYAWAIVTDKA